jgi:hypothetical protein
MLHPQTLLAATSQFRAAFCSTPAAMLPAPAVLATINTNHMLAAGDEVLR